MSYKQIIQTATGCADSEVAQVEEILRQDVFHSTLDWQTKTQLSKGAVEAYEIYKELKAMGLIQ